MIRVELDGEGKVEDGETLLRRQWRVRSGTGGRLAEVILRPPHTVPEALHNALVLVGLPMVNAGEDVFDAGLGPADGTSAEVGHGAVTSRCRRGCGCSRGCGGGSVIRRRGKEERVLSCWRVVGTDSAEGSGRRRLADVIVI